MKHLYTLFFLIPVLCQAQVELNLVEIASGYSNPSEIVNAGDERLFIIEQAGRIKILYTDGTQVSTSFLDITNQVSDGGEKGLLGLAFAPDYCESGYFFVNYTAQVGGQLITRVSRFSVDPDNENLALPNSEEVVLEVDQDFGNHNGGHIEFGPDGYLYIGMGDGGSGNDPNNRAQDMMSMLGKMLRIDVSSLPYTIPADNPFADDDFAVDEMWSLGLRNPWRFAFDSETGDMYIGDVGQGAREEVSYQAAGTEGGLNYGWRCREGSIQNSVYPSCVPVTTPTEPIFDYVYGNNSNGFRCAITGGRVYRGKSFPAIEGMYLFTDYCSGEWWALGQDGDDWESETGPGFPSNIVTFGEDVWGEVYAGRGGSQGRIYRVEEESGSLRSHIEFDGVNTISSLLDGVSFEWYLDGELLQTTDSPELDITQVGTYGLIITSENGCEIEANDLEILVIGTTDTSVVSEFTLFPNPSSGSLTIEVALIEAQEITATLMTLDGKVVQQQILSGQNIQQTMSSVGLDAGIYFVQLSTADGSRVASKKWVLVK